MKPKMYLGVLLIIVTVIMVFTGSKLMAAGNDAAPAIGHLAPDFTLTNLNGKNIQLKEITGQNKVTLVNFWATWCPPCRGEIPELVKLYQKYGSQKMALLAVNLQEDPGQVKAFAADKRMSFPILIDNKGQVANKYQVTGIPTTFIVDRQGYIRDFIVGGTTYGVLEAKIQPLLKGH